MNLDKAKEYSDTQIRMGATSDGCTYAPDFGIKKWCTMHDMLIRFRPVSSLEADNLFFQGIMTEGFKYLPVAIIYWLFVRWVSLLGGKPLPAIGLLVFLISIGFLAYFTQ